jgi:hypothetical protein
MVLLKKSVKKSCLTMIFSVAESDSHSKMRVYAEFMNSFRDAAGL